MNSGTAVRDTELQNVTRGHWDLDLKWWGSNMRAASRSCYVVPPVGSFMKRKSHCGASRSSGWVRASPWSALWMCPGTRRLKDAQCRKKVDAPRLRRRDGRTDWQARSRAVHGTTSVAQRVGGQVPDARMARIAGGCRPVARGCAGKKRQEAHEGDIGEKIATRDSAKEKSGRSIIRAEATASLGESAWTVGPSSCTSDAFFEFNVDPNEPSAAGRSRSNCYGLPWRER